MRDELFKFYVELGHNLYYLRAYRISARRISNAYSGFLMLASAGGIVTLTCWDKMPVLWAIIAAAAQALQALKPLLQSSKQRDALQYILQDTTALFDEVSMYWDTVGARECSLDLGEEIADNLARWMDLQRKTSDRFSANLDFPFKKRLEKKAKMENTRYFWYHYGVRPEEEL